MKISTEINTLARFVGTERATDLVGRAGFDAWDLSLFGLVHYDYATRSLQPSAGPFGGDYLAHVRLLKSIGDSWGMVCNQSHAPFPSHVAGMRDYLKRALECTAEAGGDICVIHPDGATSEEVLEMFVDLLPFAKGCGVRMAAENIAYRNKETDTYMPHFCSDPAGFVRHIDAVNDPYLVACLDIAHAELKGLGTSAVEMIHALGTRLQALHIHDNDCWHDQHKLPFTAKIDFAAVVKALKDVDYRGYFTMECDSFVKETAAEDPMRCVTLLAKTAKRLADMFDGGEMTAPCDCG